MKPKLNSCKTKAGILIFLKDRLKKSSIGDMFVFTILQYITNKKEIIEKIMSSFHSKKIIIRSSAINEDTKKSSMAGYYKSVLNVDKDNFCEINDAIDRVICSYEKFGPENVKNEIIAQEQIENISMSGVVLTRQISNGAPYYVINYDEETGKTDTVTSGKINSVIYISHSVKKPYKNKWKKIIEAVKEIESFFRNPVDVEFAVKKNGEVVIFQVRNFIACKLLSQKENNIIFNILTDIKQKIYRSNKRAPHLHGRLAIFGDMPDWNPAEIIGDRPNTLAYSLYSYIITDEVWLRARSSLGYADVFPGELMIAFGKKPYIDARLSFNSFIPASLKPQLKEKLINYYLNKLKNNPGAQDKVEFEILWTCYDFTLKNKIKELLDYGFSYPEINDIIKSLHSLTNKILENWSDLIRKDFIATRELTLRRDMALRRISHPTVSLWEIITAAHYIFDNCKELGTLPFSRTARLAFISKDMMLSLLENGTISKQFYQSFLGSIENIATRISKAIALLRNKKLSKDKFLEKYGHLRLGTYDITAPTYKELIDLLSSRDGNSKEIELNAKKKFPIDTMTKKKVARQLKDHKLNLSVNNFFNFLKDSIIARETTKFEFTKSLSTAIELIAILGKRLGFSREQMSHIDYSTFIKFRNPEHSDMMYTKKILKQSMDRHIKEGNWSEKIILPPIITSPEDLVYVTGYQARPNFVTQKIVQGKPLFLNKTNFTVKKSFVDSIIIIENADPGFDWIFSKSPLGLITKYGGVASHMAIRCAEFSLPAAIGCGNEIFNRLLNSEEILLDCANKVIRPLVDF